MNKYTIAALLVVITGFWAIANSMPYTWSDDFTKTQQREVAQFVAMSSGAPMSHQVTIAECFVNKAKRSYRQVEWTRMDYTPEGRKVSGEILKQCFCELRIEPHYTAGCIGVEPKKEDSGRLGL